MKAEPIVFRPALKLDARQRIEAKAPARPPCFDSEAAWHEYLAWCAASEEDDFEPTVVTAAPAVPNQPARRVLMFNTALPFCRDCERGAFKARMRREGRCRPDWLVDHKQAELLEAACA